MPTVQILDATIAAGASLSNSVDCTTKTPQLISVPPNWTAANMTFQMSGDNTTFYDVVGPDGQEIDMAAVPGTTVTVPGHWAVAAAYIKVRSGSRNFPVKQAAAATVQIALV
jgi:hypothetical protein